MLVDEQSMNVIYTFPPTEQATTTCDGPKKPRVGIVLLFSMVLVIMTGLLVMWTVSDGEDDDSKLTVDDIRSMIIETATHRPENSIHPNGGVLGSWWIYATESAGDSLLGLCLESRESHIGASRAFMIIDAEDDTLSFILENAVVAVLPHGQIDGSLERHASLEIGPIPLIVDVINDEDGDDSNWHDPNVANAGSGVMIGF